jgi:hypothetical protein
LPSLKSRRWPSCYRLPQQAAGSEDLILAIVLPIAPTRQCGTRVVNRVTLLWSAGIHGTKRHPALECKNPRRMEQRGTLRWSARIYGGWIKEAPCAGVQGGWIKRYIQNTTSISSNIRDGTNLPFSSIHSRWQHQSRAQHQSTSETPDCPSLVKPRPCYNYDKEE